MIFRLGQGAVTDCTLNIRQEEWRLTEARVNTNHWQDHKEDHGVTASHAPPSWLNHKHESNTLSGRWSDAGPRRNLWGNWIFVGIEIMVITCCYISSELESCRYREPEQAWLGSCNTETTSFYTEWGIFQKSQAWKLKEKIWSNIYIVRWGSLIVDENELKVGAFMRSGWRFSVYKLWL